jgi:antitoxin PrlF
MNPYHRGMKTTVSEKGQITIPKAVRTKLGIRPGTVLELEAERGRLIGRKAGGRDAIDELYGSMLMDEPVDDYLERTRGR